MERYLNKISLDAVIPNIACIVKQVEQAFFFGDIFKKGLEVLPSKS